MKKIRVLSILCMALALTALFILADPTEASAATVIRSGTCGANLTWTLDDEGTLTISGTGAMENYSTNGYSPWNSYRDSVKMVIIKKGVTNIGDYAFYYCNFLTSVDIPNSVTSIGESAFNGCRSLTTIEIPDSVTSIGKHAFIECWNLTTIEIPDSVTNIGFGAFMVCENLTTVNLPVSLTSIEPGLFWFCDSLTSVEIPDGVTSIGYRAFGYCSLTTIDIPSSVTSIGEEAFYCCDELSAVYITDLAAWCQIDFSYNYGNPLQIAHNLYLDEKLVEDLVIPDGVTGIGDCAFFSCTSLTSIEIPDSVTSIGDYAFYNCNRLPKIEIPDSVTSIGDYAFWCTSLTRIKFTGNAPTFVGNDVFRKVTATAYYPADDATWTEEVRQDYGGTITWVPYSVGDENKGDFDGDGEITNKDVEYLLWYTLFPESYPIETDADLNGDGQVDNLDVEYLLWHTLFPDSYPL